MNKAAALEYLLSIEYGYKFTDSHPAEEECKICYDSLKGEYVTTGACGCVLHWGCVRKWMIDNKKFYKCGRCGKAIMRVKRNFR